MDSSCACGDSGSILIVGDAGDEEDWLVWKKANSAQTRREEEMVMVKNIVLKMRNERMRCECMNHLRKSGVSCDEIAKIEMLGPT